MASYTLPGALLGWWGISMSARMMLLLLCCEAAGIISRSCGCRIVIVNSFVTPFDPGKVCEGMMRDSHCASKRG